mmetsp:Transcript_64052/g.119026  ORF Transcript_64052/g.119026 Transcript_64052/m.119026 type:complete len:276 (+) Transcript_64052:102-929(+)
MTQVAERAPPPTEGQRSYEVVEDEGAFDAETNARCGTSASAPTLMMSSNSTPGPGYVWDDNVHRRRVPTWTVTSPDRNHLDLMVGTWTPASMSLQPRAPDPGEYGDISKLGPRGKYTSPGWSIGNSKAKRQTLDHLDGEESLTMMYKLPPTIGRWHPTNKTSAAWSVYGKDRSHLPMGTKTWTPQVMTDIRPGPGQYNLDRKPRYKASSNRRGCTWGARTQNLHPGVPAWVSATRGTRLLDGEHSRMRKPIGHPWNCSCKVCPGPGLCKDLKHGP